MRTHKTFALLLLLLASLQTTNARAQTPKADATPQQLAASGREARAEELAAACVKASTEEGCTSLLRREPELFDEDLARRVYRTGKALYDQNRYADSLPPLRLALALSERLGSLPVQADALRVIGLAARLLGNYDESFECSFRSLALSRQAGYREGEARVLNNLGLTYQMRGDYARASDYYRQSLSIFEELKTTWAVGATLTSLGNVAKAQGDNALAFEFFGRGLALAREAKNPKAEGNAMTYIGALYDDQGDSALALDHLTRALELFTSMKDKDGMAMVLNNIGIVYRRQGDGQGALDCYQRALKLYEEMDSKSSVAANVSNIGNVFGEAGDYAQALAYHERALRMFEEMDERPHAASVLSDMAHDYELSGDHVKAREYAARAAELARQLGRMSIYQEALTTAGRAALGLNQPAAARESFEEAIVTVEALRDQVAGAEPERESFFEHRAEPYREMVSLLVSQKNAADALAYAERAKGRVLLDVLRGGRADVSKAMTAGEREREQGLKGALYALNSQLEGEGAKKQPDPARLGALRAQVGQARLRLEDFRNGLYAAHPELRVRRGEAHALRPDELSPLVEGPGDALLEYVVAGEKTFLFAVTRDGAVPSIKVFTINVGEKELGARVEKFRSQLAQRGLGYEQQARELYDLLLKPAAEALRGRSSLVFVPDGALWELPFQALQPAAGRFLLEDVAVSYAPSLTVLREQRARRRSAPAGAPTLLAFGDPSAEATAAAGARTQPVSLGSNLAPLPEAARQVSALARLYGRESSRVYTGAEAREDYVKAEAGHYRVLQFATHGVLDDSSPMYSHLVLAPRPGNEDGRLEVWEMMDLNLSADLVVLSACETARGRVSEGEGVIGMSWALFVAGAPAAVVSQWKVDSASTTELMLGFHKNLRAAAAPLKAEALRRAALSLMRTPEYRHPFYWAGFIVVGDAR